MTKPSNHPPAPSVSIKTIPMASFLVDVYGLDELPTDGAPTHCLWLLHPRGHSRAVMADIAHRTVHAWNEHIASGPATEQRKPGLIALAFDMPNHGSRMVSERGNTGWSSGNENHAMDMLSMVRGGRSDMSALMDLVEGYLQRQTASHICLGWSLGGHCAWQALFGEERISAAVVIVGCPDLTSLMTSRAKKAGLQYEGPFLGSKYFPPDLLSLFQQHDPKALIFSTDAVPQPPLSSDQQDKVRAVLSTRLQGKAMLLCSGANDKLVPYAAGKPFLNVLEDAIGEGGWYSDSGIAVDDRVYEGAGHEFSDGMVLDAVDWMVKALDTAKGERSSFTSVTKTSSKATSE